MSLTPITPRRPLRWPPSIEAIRAILAPEEDVYLVGGAVRDAYLHLPLHDIDLATPGDGRPLARRIADRFDGAYYPLDKARGVGRALIPWDGDRLIIDIAQFRGPDLFTDLQKRDFSLNAMAVRLTGDLQAVIDPVGGLSDLDAKRLRECNPQSIASDPVRALRAIRASVVYKLRIDPATLATLKHIGPELVNTSGERLRDELFAILRSNRPTAALRALCYLDLLPYILPEVDPMRGVEQGPPHQFDVWQHTLMTVEHLDTLLRALSRQGNDTLTANVQIGTIVIALGNVHGQLQDHLESEWPNTRPHRALLLLAALLHDAGKPATRTVEPDDRVRFLRHEQVGAEIVSERASELRLSRGEITRLTTIVQHHMRPHWLHNDSKLPSSRAMYRFWRDTGIAGIDICLLALADYLGTYGPTLDTQSWASYVATIRALLETYFLRYKTPPPPLVKGKHLMRHFGLEPGPQIGELLEHVREGQAVGDITTRKEALDWVQRFLENHQTD